jgi:hypothetical protein
MIAFTANNAPTAHDRLGSKLNQQKFRFLLKLPQSSCCFLSPSAGTNNDEIAAAAAAEAAEMPLPLFENIL